MRHPFISARVKPSRAAPLAAAGVAEEAFTLTRASFVALFAAPRLARTLRRYQSSVGSGIPLRSQYSRRLNPLLSKSAITFATSSGLRPPLLPMHACQQLVRIDFNRGSSDAYGRLTLTVISSGPPRPLCLIYGQATHRAAARCVALILRAAPACSAALRHRSLRETRGRAEVAPGNSVFTQVANWPKENPSLPRHTCRQPSRRAASRRSLHSSYTQSRPAFLNSTQLVRPAGTARSGSTPPPPTHSTIYPGESARRELIGPPRTLVSLRPQKPGDDHPAKAKDRGPGPHRLVRWRCDQ